MGWRCANPAIDLKRSCYTAFPFLAQFGHRHINIIALQHMDNTRNVASIPTLNVCAYWTLHQMCTSHSEQTCAEPATPDDPLAEKRCNFSKRRSRNIRMALNPLIILATSARKSLQHTFCKPVLVRLLICSLSHGCKAVTTFRVHQSSEPVRQNHDQVRQEPCAQIPGSDPQQSRN